MIKKTEKKKDNDEICPKCLEKGRFHLFLNPKFPGQEWVKCEFCGYEMRSLYTEKIRDESIKEQKESLKPSKSIRKYLLTVEISDMALVEKKDEKESISVDLLVHPEIESMVNDVFSSNSDFEHNLMENCELSDDYDFSDWMKVKHTLKEIKENQIVPIIPIGLRAFEEYLNCKNCEHEISQKSNCIGCELEYHKSLILNFKAKSIIGQSKNSILIAPPLCLFCKNEEEDLKCHLFDFKLTTFERANFYCPKFKRDPDK